jgi:hypothetical protein
LAATRGPDAAIVQRLGGMGSRDQVTPAAWIYRAIGSTFGREGVGVPQVCCAPQCGRLGQVDPVAARFRCPAASGRIGFSPPPWETGMSETIFQWFRIAEVHPDGTETISPMKAWLRQHPDQYPFDATEKNSRTIAHWLKQHGWQSKETPGAPGEPGEVLLYPPGSVQPPPRPEDEDEGDGYGFRLEAELRDFLAGNLGLVKIGSGPLTLVGTEYPTVTGPIDILANDSSGAFYVFELKRAASPDKAIGQVTRYMGWVMEKLANGKPVHGVIVAKTITENLKYAVLAVPGVSLFEYQILFTLKPATHRVV